MPIKEILENVPASSRTADDADNLMDDAEYLRNSQKLIADSLREGYDVLQLDNGDIVVTGTKTFTNQYRWDDKSNKMKKLSEAQRKKETKK